MRRETKTFNKSNWSGEEATVYFNGSSWSQAGYRFRLKPVLREAGQVVAYEIRGSSWEHPLGDVYWDGVQWLAQDDDEGGISREDADPRVAAAQLLFNTV